MTTAAARARGVCCAAGVHSALLDVAPSLSNWRLGPGLHDGLWLNSRELQMLRKCSLGTQGFFFESLPFFFLSHYISAGWAGDYFSRYGMNLSLKGKMEMVRRLSLCWLEVFVFVVFFCFVFFVICLFVSFGLVLATWHQYHIFPEGTPLTNHSSVLNEYCSEQRCWDESCLGGLLIGNQLPE